MNTAQRIDIWERVHEYVAACGGDSSAATVSARRERAVAALERCVEAVEYQAPVAPPWLSDVAEALGLVRPSDGAPLALNWTQALEEIRDLRDDRDHWKKRAEQAEYAIDLPRCKHCGCLVTAHAVDDEERRQCLDCACKQFEVLDG
jgi:hypothetical protein